MFPVRLFAIAEMIALEIVMKERTKSRYKTQMLAFQSDSECKTFYTREKHESKLCSCETVPKFKGPNNIYSLVKESYIRDPNFKRRKMDA